MKEKLQKMFSLNRPIREVLFNVISIFGFLGGIISIILSLIFGLSVNSIFLLIIAECIILYCIHLSEFKKKTKLAAAIICGSVALVIFPYIFVKSGGVSSGMSAWLLLGIVFTTLLLEGKVFVIMTILQVILYSVCFYIAYKYPQFAESVPTRKETYLDVWQCTLVVTVVICAIIKFQVFVYERFNKILNKAKIEAEEAKAEAIKANKEKDNFLAKMSHEIRTPINAILGMDEMILRETENQDIINYAGAIQGAGRSLLVIINDILDFSKIESGKMEIIPSNYEIGTVLNDCCSMISRSAIEKALEFVVRVSPDMPSELVGDEVRIRQILTNFLSNAVKYTEKGTITLDVSYDKVDEENITLKISVSDTGIGITAEDKEKLFNSFQRVDEKKNHKIQGTGLGLSIVKQLTEKMNGIVGVESIYGVGSKFYVEIPQGVKSWKPMEKLVRRFKDAPNRKGAYQQLFTAPDAKILLVDDVQLNIQVTKNLLKMTKIQIDSATSGFESIELVKKTKYDLILMDHMMPGMNGIETLEKMNTLENNLNHDTPVIMLTANAVAGMHEEYLKHGFSDYISKPVDGVSLERVIRKHLPKKLIVYGNDESVDVAEEKLEISENETDLKKLLPLLDKELALKYCCESEEILNEVFEEYVKDNRLELMNELFNKKDWAEYAIQAHALKSTSLTIGIRELSEKAKSLEMAAKECIETILEDKHEDTMKDYKNVLDKLKIYLTNIKEI